MANATTIAEQIETLLNQASGIEMAAAAVQGARSSSVATDAIRKIRADYQNWYADCLVILDTDISEDFQKEYKGGTLSPKIKAFLDDPTKVSPLFSESGDSEQTFPYWQHPFPSAFAAPFNEQVTLLKQQRARQIAQSNLLSASGTSPNDSATPTSRRIFIGHGHNQLIRFKVKDFIQNRCNLEPIVLEDVANEGLTIIEKLEKYGRDVDFAILILTGDDASANKSMRARQNVVYELGWFHGALGRQKAVALRQSGVEGFSNIDGVIYIPFDGDDIEVTFDRLRQELEAAQLLSGMNTDAVQ